jgi:hypothetical protein
LAYPKLILFAIPNGGKRGKIEASIMKAEGVLAGVADLFLAASSTQPAEPVNLRPQYTFLHGLFIEMKHGSGKQTDTQKEFQKKVIEQGYKYVVCKTFDEFKYEVELYLK